MERRRVSEARKEEKEPNKRSKATHQLMQTLKAGMKQRTTLKEEKEEPEKVRRHAVKQYYDHVVNRRAMS
jgi:hypothetical protein